jgi:hypothetical protein
MFRCFLDEKQLKSSKENRNEELRSVKGLLEKEQVNPSTRMHKMKVT